MARQIAPRSLLFLFFVSGTVIGFWGPLRELFGLALQSELYSHILLIPFVSGYLVYSKKEVFGEGAGYAPLAGTAVLAGAIVLYLISMNQQKELSRNDYLSLVTLSAVTSWIGGFILIFGMKVFRALMFPLLFLIFVVPIPDALIDGLITLFQRTSAELVDVLFTVLGLTYVREGVTTFRLPTVAIEVARECSGIRSSLVLIIMGVLMTHLFLKTAWARGVFFLFILPVAIVKNAIRIITLTLLTIYVDPGILSSPLHRRGGVVFFMIALGILSAIMFGLRKAESRKRD